MKLSEHNRKTLMLVLHKKIEEYADQTVDSIEKGNVSDLLVYPPNGGLTDSEVKALGKLKNDEVLKSALRKILADNSAGIVFDLMNILDETADPDEDLGSWAGVALVDQSDDIEPNDDMLHDSFFSTYWDWKEVRPEKGWALDTE